MSEDIKQRTKRTVSPLFQDSVQQLADEHGLEYHQALDACVVLAYLVKPEQFKLAITEAANIEQKLLSKSAMVAAVLSNHKAK